VEEAGTRGIWSISGRIGFVKDYKLKSPPWKNPGDGPGGQLPTLDPALLDAAGLGGIKQVDYRGYTVTWCAIPVNDKTKWIKTHIVTFGDW
jgi:hypothetical protein